MNILQASLLAMKRAIEGLEVLPELVLVDGIHPPLVNISTKTIIKGDQSERSIMAASILAKVSRDNYMRDLDTIYPIYGFKQHKGYPTKMHLEALNSYGITKEHRLSFKPVKNIHESNK
jgi:ribonuclease HII